MSTTRAEGQRLPASAPKTADRLKWVYRGVALWLIVTYLRPQDMVPPLRAIFPGYIACAIMLIAWFKCKDTRYVRHPWSKLHLSMIFIIGLGIIPAVNTRWLYESFVSMITYWVVFFLCLPLLMESPEYRRKIIKILFLSFGVIGFWVTTHGGHGQGAFLGDENDAALALAVGFGLCYPLTCEFTGRLGKIFAYTVLILCVVGIIFSMSRGGFLGLVAVLIAVAFFSGRILKTLSGFILVALLALPFISDKYVKEMNTISDPSESTAAQRLYMWRIATQEYMSNPLIGVGAGNYPYRVGDYENTDFVQRANIFDRSFAGRAVHSAYFQLLSELGTAGAIIFFTMALGVLRQGVKVGRAPPNKAGFDIPLAQGTAGAMCAFLVAGAFVSVLFYPPFWMICSLTMSATASRNLQSADLKSETPKNGKNKY